MPIKRQQAVVAAPKIKRGLPKTATIGGATKETLEGHLLVITRKGFDSDFPTANGPSPKVVVDIIDLDDAGQVHLDFWAFGVMARRIAEWLEADGEIGLGRITTGTSKAGRQFWTVEWSDDDDDHARAEVAPF